MEWTGLWKRREKSWINTEQSYLFQIQGDGDPFVLGPVLQAGALPPAGGAVNSMRNGVPLVMIGGVRIAHPALRSPHLHVLHQLAVHFWPGRSTRRVHRNGGARRQVEDAREQASAAPIVPAVTAARVCK
jgi:hypothetical protein